MNKNNYILTINGGSSSIKFSLYSVQEQLEQLFYGAIENIGSKKAKLHFTDNKANKNSDVVIEVADHAEAGNYLINFLEKQAYFDSIKAIGHRIVHGMQHTAPEGITPDLITALKEISAFDPEHLPNEINLIESFAKRFPSIQQVACFDTGFHTSMPTVAKILPIPRRYYNMGIQRYGFHGLSYDFLMQELERVMGKETAKGKIIMAHLGNGASLAAVKDGKSIDTSMGFTPTSGVPMGTRTGDLDPGVAWYLMQFEKCTAQQFSHMINHESGMLGISETNADMRELTEIESSDHRAKEAIEVFCYQTKKYVGAYAAALGGLDTLIFSGGIGEHSPQVRSKICDGLEFLGIELNEINNMNNNLVISGENSKAKVYVMKTNEEFMIAKMVLDFINT